MSLMRGVLFASALLVSSLSFAYDDGGRVCFYENANYNGQSFCMQAGQQDANLAGFFNDRISSISIEGDLQVTIYRDANYGGGGITFDENVANLANVPGDWNDKTSSIVVQYASGGGGTYYPPRPIPIQPRPIPRPQPGPIYPEPRPEPRPMPGPAPRPEPRPAPAPAPRPEPRPVPAPAPRPEPRPAPAPAPRPSPSPSPRPSPEPGNPGRPDPGNGRNH